MIRGISVTLINHKQTGTDEIGDPVYDDVESTVENVLVGEPSPQEILSATELYGRKITYLLGIPKGDTHEWENADVKFWGHTFHVVGIPAEGIEAMIPLAWNKKVQVERVDG